MGEGDPPTGSWSRNGCHMTSEEGSVVVCECNHLTHFAILLSPGVEVCMCVCVCVCVCVRVFHPNSDACCHPINVCPLSLLTVSAGARRGPDHPWLCLDTHFSAGTPADNVNLYQFQVPCIGAKRTKKFFPKRRTCSLL